MNSHQLQCFIYVAERLNFTKAAEALFLSVPTVTHHIKSLEEELGTVLFYRNSRVVKLTEQGEKFYFDAKDIFTRMETVRNRFQCDTEQKNIFLRIGCMTEIELKKLEPALKQMREAYPFVCPKIMIRDYFELKNLYENQQLDLVISAGGMSEYGNFKKISTYESCAVMVDHHPLAHEKELTFEQIASENLITLSPKYIPFQKGNRFQEYLTLHAQDHIHIVSEGEAESILLAKCGYGIALLPEFLIALQEGMVCIPMVDAKNIDYGIFYKNKEKYIHTFINNYMKTSDTYFSGANIKNFDTLQAEKRDLV